MNELKTTALWVCVSLLAFVGSVIASVTLLYYQHLALGMIAILCVAITAVALAYGLLMLVIEYDNYLLNERCFGPSRR